MFIVYMDADAALNILAFFLKVPLIMCCCNIIRLIDGIETGIKNLVEQPVLVLTFFGKQTKNIKAIIYAHILPYLRTVNTRQDLQNFLPNLEFL